MSENPSKRALPWAARTLLGGLLGSIFGILYLLPDFTAKGLFASMVAGAVFFSIIGAFGVLFYKRRGVTIALSMIAGAIAGWAWAQALAANPQVPIVWGSILGLIMAVTETKASQVSNGREGE